MCRFKSCLILKDRVYVPDHDSHEIMLEELNIKDTFENEASIFARAEIYPEDGDIFSDVTGWKMRVDQDILPEWYVPEIDESRAKVAVAEWMKNHTISEGEQEVRDGVLIAYGRATVEACGRAKIMACGSATVMAGGSATVKANGSATVRAYGNAKVTACDDATVTAWDSAEVIAYERATVKAYGSATVKANGSATVKAFGSAMVTANEITTVKAYEKATVKAFGSATVVIPINSCNNMDNVEVNNNAIAIDHNTNTIKANKKWKMKDVKE